MRTKIWDGEARGNVNCAFSEIGNGLVAALEEHKIDRFGVKQVALTTQQTGH